MLGRAAAIVVACIVLLTSYLAHVWNEALTHASLDAPRPTEIVFDRSGAFLTQVNRSGDGKTADYGYWPLESIPERLASATLALEDRRFDQHDGVDLRAIFRAALRNIERGRFSEGASTIAMQVARLQHPQPRSLLGKVQEALAGAALTRRYGRTAVLAQYLRLAPYGAASHGAAHAARFYFNKPIGDLSLAETALLAAIPQSPTRMNIARDAGLRLAVGRARRAIATLEQELRIDHAQAEAARRELADMRPVALPRRPEDLHLALRYERLVHSGALAAASSSDPRIRASVDLPTQADLARLTRRYLNGFRAAGATQVALMVVKRSENIVLADIGSADYRGAGAGAIDFSRASRSPGSTLKPFVYALALERGALKSTDLLADAPEGAAGIGNADGVYLGLIPARQALANSRNAPAANLLRRLGLAPSFQFLHELGLHDLEAPPDSFGLSMAIGSLPTTLENLMRAYAALADDGVLPQLRYATDQGQAPPRRVMSVDTARLITSFLSDPLARLPTFPRYGPIEYPFPVAVKTGTSQGYRDAWTIAFSKDYLVGAWLGRADAGTMKELSGASSAARLVHAVMTRLHGARPGDILLDAGFPPPPGREPIDLCLAGFGPSCAAAIREWAKPEDAKVSPAPAASRQLAVSEDPPLVIATPEHGAHIWVNRDLPSGLNLLALKLKAPTSGRQIVWHIDGAPYQTAAADETVFWPMQPGVHRFEARPALWPGASRPVKVTIE
jgi:penicillin-binding protein 1C